VLARTTSSVRTIVVSLDAAGQRTLYAPGPVTRKDGNELIILELGATAGGAVEFVSGNGKGL
jgi:hypothetical protein